MKKIFIFYFLVSPIFIFSQAGKWQIQSTEFTNDLYGIYFSDSLTGYICGENGLILKTIDGANWFQQQTPTNQTLRDIFFLRDTLGWACGDSGTIIQTDNGGETWEIQPTNSTRKLNSIAFYDFIIDYRGWAAGDSSFFLKFSQDSAWLSYNNPNSAICHQVTYQNPTIYETIFLVNDRVLLTSNGNIWILLWILPHQPLAITKRIDYNILWTDRNFWMVGEHGSAYAFQQPAPSAPCYISFPPSTLDLCGVAVDEYADEVWAVGVKGRILISENEGVSYDLFASPVTEDLNNIFFSGYHTGYIVGNNGIILHYDDNNWVVSDNEKKQNPIVRLFPNPCCTDFCEISSLEPFTRITIYDGLFHEIHNVDLVETNQKRINISDFSKGMYFLVIQTVDRTIVLKLIRD